MRKIVRRFSAYGMQWDIYEDGGFRCLTVEDGGKINMKELTLNDRINGRIELNKYSINAWCTNYNLAKQFTDNNDLLGELAEYIKSHNDIEYERGLNDAWELIRKINGPVGKGGYTFHELSDMFGTIDTCQIVNYMSCQEALTKVEEYEKKKAEEAAKPVRGDVVRVTAKDNTHSYTGVYLGQSGHDVFILVETRLAPVSLYEFDYNVEKTGERVSFEYKKIGDSND